MHNGSKNIVTNSTILIGAEVLGTVIRIVLVIFAARLLGAANYGKFSFALAFTSLFLILADGGIHQLLVRELARWPERCKKYLGNALFIKFFLGFFTFSVIVLVANLTNKPADVLYTVYIIAFSQIVDSFARLFKSIFQAFQQMKYDAVSTVILNVFTTGFGIALLVSRGNYIGLALVYLAANLVNMIICIWITLRKFTPIKVEADFKLIKFFIIEGFPFGVLYFFATMYTLIDTVMLSFMKGDEVVGWYNVAYRFVFAMLFIPMGTMKAVFPIFSKYYQESLEDLTRLFEKSFKSMLLVGFSLAWLIFLFSDKLILWMFGQEYIHAVPALKILVWSAALIYITTVMTHVARASNRQQFTAKAVVSCALINIVLNLLFIPRYSFIGAAAATLITEWISFTAHYFYLSHYLVKPPLFKYLPKIVVINLIVGLYVFVLRRVPFILVFSTAMMINVGMVLLVRYYSVEELALLFSVSNMKKVLRIK